MTDLDELERLMREATPGPWRLDAAFRDDDLLSVAYIEDGSTFLIAEEVGGRRKGEDFEDESECIANAQLIAALRNAAEELIRDARRYRWLKTQQWFKDEVESCIGPDVAFALTDDELNAAIDAAISRQEGKG